MYKRQALLLPLYIGSVPLPISSLICGLVNAALVWAALQWTSEPRVAAAPVLAFLATVFLLTFFGPGGDIVFGGAGVMQVLAPLSFVVLGVTLPALVLSRHLRLTR